ncbi:MAG: cyclase family protein [Flavobacteriaceae bacterium]
MKIKLTINNQEQAIDLSKPIDISIELLASKENVNAWYLDAPKINPVVDDSWVGNVAQGGTINFNTITFNPHAHGTHTECIGHITKKFHSVNDCLKTFFFMAELISVTPVIQENMDTVITKDQVKKIIENKHFDALIIRTLPNDESKKSKQYSNSNPPYLTKECAEFIKETGIKHLLIDLPSVDKEKDDGKLEAHKAFWDFDGAQRLNATITEFIYVDNQIIDGTYLLNLQIAPFKNDASPSKPILYKLE